MDFAERYSGLYNKIQEHNYEKERFYGSRDTYSPTLFSKTTGNQNTTQAVGRTNDVPARDGAGTEKAQFNIPYQAPDRRLVFALLCEYDIARE